MEDKVCCNCGNCERRPERGSIETYCAIDNHRIGYVECFTRKCKHWKRETKWDGMEEKDEWRYNQNNGTGHPVPFAVLGDFCTTVVT